MKNKTLEQYGYQPASSGNHSIDLFNPQTGITLTIFDDGTAELFAIIGIVILKVDKFAYPHPRFELFNNAIIDAMRKLNAN